MAFLSNNTNRVLLNFISQEDFFGRILYVDGANNVEEFMLIKYNDLLSGGSYNFDYLGNGELDLNWKDPIKYQMLLEFMQGQPCVLEVFIYEDYNNLTSTQFNKFYFFDYYLFEDNPEENKKTRKFKFHSFATAIESKSMAEHSVGYYFPSIPVDSDGNKVLPDDYNKVLFNSSGFNNFINSIYDKNLFNPVKREKGDIQTPDSDRKIQGFGNVTITSPINNGKPIYILEDKQDLLSLRTLALNYLISLGELRIDIPEIKYDQLTKKLNIEFIYNENINLENGLVKDNYTSFKREVDYSVDVSNSLFESTGDDNFDATQQEPKKPWAWKMNESIGSGSVEEGESGSALQVPTDSDLIENEPNDSSQITIDFKDKLYFKDIHAGQIVNLSGYGNLVDGQYRITEISCVIEPTYLSYGIDKMERI